MKSIVLILSLTIAAVNAIAQSQPVTLKEGSPAPSISEAHWIKGDRISAFEKGQVYVIEFWATWCGPCRMSMPHLSELANEYKGKVTFMSFNSKERAYFKDKTQDYFARVKEFVQKLGDGIDYNVAIDGPEETLWKNWLTAAGFSSIPKAFIVGRDGNIAWMGHPDDMENVLAAIVNNYTDAQKEKMKAQAKMLSDRWMTLARPLREAKANKDYAAIIAITDTSIASVKPSMRSYLKTIRFEALCHSDKAAARKYGQELIQALRRDPISLYSIGRDIVFEDPSPDYEPDYELGLRFLQAAASRSDSFDQPVLSGLAKAYFRTGNVAEAVKLQKQVLQLIKEAKFMQYSETVEQKAARALAEYETTLKNGQSKMVR